MSGSLYSKNARNKWNFPDKAVTGRISILYTKTFSIQEKNMVTGIRYPDIPEMKIENESEKGRQK